MLRKTIAALGVAAITLLATPMAANAAPGDGVPGCGVGGDNYALSGTVTSDVAVVDPGGTVTVSWNDGYYMPDAQVTLETSGQGAAGSAVVASGLAATASGALWATVTVADDASGALTVMGNSDCASGGVTVQVVSATAAVSDDRLASTGSSVPVVLVIAGAGALAFGGILLGARARRRTQQ